MSLLHKSENCCLHRWSYWYKYRLKLMLDMVLKTAENISYILLLFIGGIDLGKFPVGKLNSFLLLNFMLCNLNILQIINIPITETEVRCTISSL
jgi:hypothetical protein